MRNNGLLALAIGLIFTCLYLMDPMWEGAALLKLFAFLSGFIGFVFIVESFQKPIEK